MSRPKVGDLIALGSGGYSLVSNVEDFEVAGSGDKFVELTWQDPTDVVLDGTTITSWAGTQIRRKTGNYPVNEKDGGLVVDSKTRDQYKTVPYKDSGLTNGVEYFYMAFPYTDKRVFTIDSANRISAVPADGDDKWTDIGSKFLVGGDMQAGYFGIVPASELITGDALATLVGISAGTSQFSNEGWLKFAYEGKILFVAKKTIRHSISWDHINAANCARGAVAQKTVKGHTFKIRLMKGSNAIGDSTIPDYGTASSGALNHGSEWNKLMLPIHANAAPGKSWAYPGNVGTSDTAYWGVDFTNADLQTHSDHGNGSYSWCQETAYQTTRRLRRGYDGVSHSNSNTSSAAATYHGWRPVLELVP